MTAVLPIFASERTAAKLLDLKVSEFVALVQKGALPGPIRIGAYERWEVDKLRAIASGEAMRAARGLDL